MKTSRILLIIAAVLIVLLGGALAGGHMYLEKQRARDTYFANTTVNGYDMSNLTAQQAADILVSDYSSSTVRIEEKGVENVSGKLADFGYQVDQEKLLASLTDAMNRQKSSFMVLVGSLMNGNSFTVTIPFTFYEDTFRSVVSAAAFPQERTPSINAQMKYNEKENYYYIEPETYGNEFVDAQFQGIVREQIDAFVNGNTPGENLKIDFPDNIYILPEVTEGDVRLNSTVNLYNQLCKAKITYVFGSEKESIDWNTIQNWVTIENGESVISDEMAYEYVMSLAAKYNTRHYDRTFHTSLGYDTVIASSENDYGYTIDEDGEFSQLIADIRSNKEVEREPVYYQTSSEYGNPLYYRRDGKDDLAGTYVEVNLTTQHLWFYKDYNLIVDTDVVTGSVAKKAETKTGTFPLAYKESPSVLVGSNAADGYRTEVQYWMPFYEGQGLHDASWRSSFGGNIYMTNGSHGCVNMPPYAAQMVYEQIDAGVAIIIYK